MRKRHGSESVAGAAWVLAVMRHSDCMVGDSVRLAAVGEGVEWSCSCPGSSSELGGICVVAGGDAGASSFPFAGGVSEAYRAVCTHALALAGAALSEAVMEREASWRSRAGL
jgi:hypothetical protein